MKNYNFDEIDSVLIRANQYVSAMVGFYKMQGLKIPKEVKELKHDLTQVLNKIGKKDNGN